MSSYVNIFVEGDVTLNELVATVKDMLDVLHITYDSDQEAAYELWEKHTLVLVGENPYTHMDGDNINFEDFHYDIDVCAIDMHNSVEAMKQRWQRAEEIYARLQETGKYRLMLTNDAQSKEEEFIPAQYQQPPSEYALKARQLPDEIWMSVLTHTSLIDFVHELKQLLHVTARERTSPHGDSWYRLTNGKAYFDVRQTETMGTYDIEVVGRVFISGERLYWQFESARNLYAQLKATGKYTLQLKGNDGTLFEEFSPALETKQTPTQDIARESTDSTSELPKETIEQKTDDLDRFLTENEKSAVSYLRSQGLIVVPQRESTDVWSRVDLTVTPPAGEKYTLAIKTLSPLTPPATARSIVNVIRSATKNRGEADHLLLDGRANGLTEDQVDTAITTQSVELEKTPVQSIRVLGVSFDKTYTIPATASSEQ